MAQSALVVPCRVEARKLYVPNRKRMDAAVARLKSGDYTMRLERQHAKHSDPQRGYYFAVVVERVRGKWNEKRQPGAPTFTKEMTHELLKVQFLPTDAAERGENGRLVKGLVIGGSISKLNKVEMADYLDRIIDHAAAHWDGLYIEPPNPEWREQAERELPAEDPRRTMLREKGAA